MVGGTAKAVLTRQRKQTDGKPGMSFRHNMP